MREAMEVVLDTNAIRYFIENPEQLNRLYELVERGCHNLVIPNVRTEVEGRLGTRFAGLIGAFRSRLRSKLITPSLNEDDVKSFERRVAKVRPRYRLPRGKDKLVAASAIHRADATGRGSVIVSGDPDFLNELAPLLRSFKVEVVDPRDLINWLEDP